MTRFQCIADLCEDTCCSGLKVVLSEADHDRLRSAMSATQPERERFDALIERSAPGSEGFATLRKADGGGCAALDANRLCSLHRQYGVDALANVCATFPRIVIQTGLAAELAGTLACPEVARLCLLAGDGLEPSEVGAESGDWVSAGLRILGLKQFPLSSRLAFLAYLAHPENRGSQRFVDTEHLAALHRNLRALSVPPDGSHTLWTAIFRASATDPSGRLVTLIADLSAPRAAAIAARHTLERLFSDRIEQYFRHHAMHFWLRYASGASNPLTLSLELVARSAIVEFAFWRHRALVHEVTPGELDAAAVEVVQICTRYVFPREPFRNWLASAAEGEPGDVLGRLLVLAGGSFLEIDSSVE